MAQQISKDALEISDEILTGIAGTQSWQAPVDQLIWAYRHLRDKCRAQGEEIERLVGLISAKDSVIVSQYEQIERLKARGVTERAILARADRYATAGGAAKDIIRLLKSLGLLIEELPEAAEPVSPTKHRDFMALPIEERRKQMEAQCTDEMIKHYEGVNAEADPLKVDVTKGYAPHEMEVRMAHNAHVAITRIIEDTVRQELKRIHELEQPTEQEAWPKLPDYLSPSVQAEFERIRAALGVKEM